MSEHPNHTRTHGALFRWLTGLGRWQRLGLAVVLGALMTAGHPPVSVPWVMFVALPMIALLVAAAPSPRAAAWIGWGVGFGYFVTGLHWIGHAFLVDSDRFLWLIPLGVTVLPAGLSIFWAVAFWLARRLGGRGAVADAVVLAVLWTLAEFARGNVLTGFPWALPGYVWVDTGLMQTAAWIGPYGLTGITLVGCMLPLLVLVTRAPLLLGAITAATLALLWIGGVMRVPAETAYAAEAPVLRIVQPNAPQHLKWKQGVREKFYQWQLAATALPPDPKLGKANIVIWPETSVFFIPAGSPQRRAEIARAAAGATVLMGAIHGEATATGEHWSNSLVSILPDGSVGPRYDKHHLVPFGEYLPLKPLFDAIGVSRFAVGGAFTPGAGPRTMKIGNLPAFSALICYEAIFPGEIVAATRPAWLLQPTNDAWFGSWAGPQQHYAQARFRAVEQGLPLVRAANSGISAVIDAHGREVGALGIDRDGILDARLPAPALATLYGRTGDWPALIALLLIGLSIRILGYPKNGY